MFNETTQRIKEKSPKYFVKLKKYALIIGGSAVSINDSGGGIFYGNSSVWESNLDSPQSYNLYFNQTAASFVLELDDTIIISYRTYGIYGGL